MSAPFPGLDVALDLANRTKDLIAGLVNDDDLDNEDAVEDFARLDADLDHLRDALAGLDACDLESQVPVPIHPAHAVRYARQRDRAWESLQATALAYGVTAEGDA